jgi:hypothetical protein
MTNTKESLNILNNYTNEQYSTVITANQAAKQKMIK